MLMPTLPGICLRTGAMTKQQVERGFTEMVEIVDDLVCDVPKAREYFATMQAHAHQHGLLSAPVITPATAGVCVAMISHLTACSMTDCSLHCCSTALLHSHQLATAIGVTTLSGWRPRQVQSASTPRR